MSQQDPLFVGTVGPPSALVVKITPGRTNLNPALITAADIKVKRPDGSIVTYPGTLSTGSNFPGVPAPSSAAAYFVHVYVTGDLDQDGQYVAWADNIQPPNTFSPTDEAPFHVRKR